MSDLDELRRLAEAATPGPWHAPNPPDGVGEGMLYADDGWAIVDSFLFATEERRQATSGWNVPFTRPDGQHMQDAAYIAAANPQTILSLLDRLAALEVGVKEITERLRPRNPERRDGHLGRRWADVDSAHERAAHLLSQKAEGQPDE